MQPETRVAHIDEMRAGIGQRDHAASCFNSWLHALVADIEEAAEEAGLEILVEAEIEHDVERVAMLVPRRSRRW